MRFTKLQIVSLIGILVAMHVGFAFFPIAPFSVATNLVLFFVNLFVLFSAGYVVDVSRWKKAAAFLLGYGDSNSFFRAFQGWEGTSPGEWRTRQRQAAVALVNQ